MEPFNSNLTQKETPRVLESPTDELDEELRKSAKQGEHNRDQTFRNHVNIIALIGLWGVVVAVILCGFVYLYHMLSPECWHFLNTQQLETIRTFVVTAILSSSLTNYANRHIDEK
ncbi:TPA: hypothetical protein ACPQYX_000317 [Haemophilus influenzae]|uniref:hypothetical protein n=1 Tax=Haemophilus influenzae TaxID=727 RepID=UPI0005FCB7CA|nr:hypothetical protein [Haemophilus influenzae]AKA46374.1 hypothetical protein C645_02780 [Haemophilus influenzae 2019]KKZ20658.1 hypothetical protein AAY75_08315 [Haemophilus influenzae 2019]MCK8947455.1 hypothetical protein [Haemophilus influenzae]MCK9112895.1 hypothetical protein [Haemophilus influenzae]